MNKFENIQPKNVVISINPVTQRIVAKVWVGDDFHEVAFANDRLITLQEVLEAVKEDLRENGGK